MRQVRRDDQCGKCHSEHNGEKFVPIRWDVSLDEFDHRKTGYPLEGGHAGLKCDRCHNPGRIAPAARKVILMKDLRRTYLGLSTACATCHEDKHNGQLGDQCERCHTVAQMERRHAIRPLHGQVQTDRRPCKGGVRQVPPDAAFAQCRLQELYATPASRLRSAPIVTRTRIAVRLPPAVIRVTTIPPGSPREIRSSAFDHSKTKFPLLGKHAPVTCDKCHKTSDFTAPVAHMQCKACHQDIHGGQFAARADSGDCASCHTADGWKPSTYTVASHVKSLYPLLGKHAAVACDKCHLPARAATLYKVRYQECLDCHRDPHAGQFADSVHRNRCEDCHTVERFQPAKFTLSRHDQTRFPLAGGHIAVACGDCHRKTVELHNAEAYKFTDLSCTGCHVDPHQPPVRVRPAVGDSQGTACEVCHNARTWRQVASFDHSKTRFALTGAHRGAACEQCHRSTALSLGAHKVVFQGAPLACVGCHEDVHAGQFAAMSESQGCEACHDNIKWKSG